MESEDVKPVAMPRKQKQKVDHACVYCRRSHMTCDSNRPCSRCIKRSIGHLCHDEPKTKREHKDEHVPLGTHIVMDSPNMFVSKTQQRRQNHNSLQQQQQDHHLQQQMIPHSLDQQQQQSGMGGSNNGDGNYGMQPMAIGNQSGANANDQDQLASGLTQSMTSTGGLGHPLSMNHNPVFFSEHAGSEFSSLNDFLSIIDDPSLLDQSFLDINDPKIEQQNIGGGSKSQSQALQAYSGNGTNTSNNNGNNNNSDPMDSAKDKFFLTAADPSEDISPEERLKQVIHAKVEAGLLQPFNYALGYQRLQRFMDNYMNHSSKQRILKPLSILRPAFRAVAQSLKDLDLVLVEESFERMLLEYDRVFTSMAIPACLWRRTGEIYRGNKEFAGLVDVNVEDLRDGKLAIYELMSEESAVNYWEKYGNIAFDSGQKAVLTSCNLRARDGRKRRACCFSFTVRRDRYNIPSCIIGNFIPVHN